MGWAYCGQDYYGREIGYGIFATCDTWRCDEVINRGLGTVCGDMHGAGWDGEPGCGRYFCDKHHGGIGERGGCPHQRSKKPWGKTKCQLMERYVTAGTVMDPVTKRFRPAVRPEYYCACHEWKLGDVPDLPAEPLKEWWKVGDWWAHAKKRGFYSHPDTEGPPDVED